MRFIKFEIALFQKVKIIYYLFPCVEVRFPVFSALQDLLPRSFVDIGHVDFLLAFNKMNCRS